MFLYLVAGYYHSLYGLSMLAIALASSWPFRQGQQTILLQHKVIHPVRRMIKIECFDTELLQLHEAAV